MKKKIVLLALVAVVMTNGIFATPVKTEVNNQVLTAFTTKFDGAKEVTWNTTDQYIRANFVRDEQAMSAYFDVNGELIGVSKNILSQQLPISLNIQLKKLIANGWITELFEFTNGQETSYFVTIENADQKVCLKGSGSNDWSIFKKAKKN